MDKERQEKIQAELDSMVFDNTKGARLKKADARIEEKDKVLLYEAVEKMMEYWRCEKEWIQSYKSIGEKKPTEKNKKALEDLEESYEKARPEVKKGIDNVLLLVVRVLKEYGYNDGLTCNIVSKEKDGNLQEISVYNNRKVMPFLVKQVLFFGVLMAMEFELKCNNKKENKESSDWTRYIVDYLSDNEIKVSKNFFSRMELTPSYYFMCSHFYAVKNPCKYMGQKKGELGIAIKNLIYQAGKHSGVVDVFGGSGAASMSIAPKNHRMLYVYNEKNTSVYNYFATLASEEYSEVISVLQKIQDDLYNKERKISAYEFDINDEIDKYIKSQNGRIMQDIEKIKEYVNMSVQYDSKIMEGFEKEFDIEDDTSDTRKKYEEFITHSINNGKCSKSSYIEFTKMRTIQDFSDNEDVIWGIHDFSFFLHSNLTWKKYVTLGNEEVTYAEWRQRLRQYKALGYFCFFYNMSNKEKEIAKEERVKYAVGEIFLHYFNTHGTIGPSAIVAEVVEDCWRNKRNVIHNFVNEDFETTITLFHEQAKNKKCICQDFKDVIEGCSIGKLPKGVAEHDKKIIESVAKLKDVIFYCDPPYVETVGYTQKFDYEKEMPQLIQLLQESKRKFVYSMRAVKTKGRNQRGEMESTLSQKDYEDIAESNNKIDKYVYKEFNKRFKSLWVLVIHNQDEEIEQLIRNHKVVEIMITNFQIQSFRDENASRISYDVFTYQKYMELLENNMYYGREKV